MRTARSKCLVFLLSVAALAACTSDDSPGTASGGGANVNASGIDANNAVVQIDTRCDVAEYPSPDFIECEAQNVARTLEANQEQLNADFQTRALQQYSVNLNALLARSLNDPSWTLPPAFGNTGVTPLCAAGILPCVGDPFRYPGVDGPDGKVFYEQEAEVQRVVYYDQGCARITGQVWRPRNNAGAKLPAIVIKNGSVQANEQLYWWAAQTLVRAGYMVLTNDPRGQGLSDFSTPTGEQGGNFNGTVFYEGLVNDIDFLMSSPAKPYPHNISCAGTYPTKTTAFNPFHVQLDADRIGLAGHSYGAGGVTWVQSYGAADSLPWPGKLSTSNPVKAIVAWDALGSRDEPLSATLSSLAPTAQAGGLAGLIAPSSPPRVSARVPAMGFTSEYGFTPVPFVRNPARDEHQAGFKQWQASGQPVYQITIAGSTHLDYSLGALLPATSWCPEIRNNACVGGWARPMITHYTLAWFDRHLKQAGEQGHDTADARLLDDAQWAPRMSFHFASARDFSTRDGRTIRSTDIRGQYRKP